MLNIWITAGLFFSAIISHTSRVRPRKSFSSVASLEHQAPFPAAHAASSLAQKNASVRPNAASGSLKPRPPISQRLLSLLSVSLVPGSQALRWHGNPIVTSPEPVASGENKRAPLAALVLDRHDLDSAGMTRSLWPSQTRLSYGMQRLRNDRPGRSRSATMSVIEREACNDEECPIFFSEGYGIARLQVADVELSIIEEEMCSLEAGSCVWDSGLALALLLGNDPATAGKHIVELGSGTGIGGLSAAAAGADVVLSDRSDDNAGSISLLKENIALNGLQDSVIASELEWGDHASAEIQARGPFDLICGSDVLYQPGNFDHLLDTLVDLSTPGKTEVILTYPIRYTEDIFFTAAADHFDEMETYRVEKLDGLENNNIWYTRLRRKALA